MVQQDALNLYVGQKLREIRRQAGRSRIEAAAAIGVQPEELRKFETGVERVPAAVLLHLSKAFQFDVLEFFRGVPAKERVSDSASVAMASQAAEGAEEAALLRNFSRIRSQSVRQTILSLVAGYAENETAKED